MMSGRRQRVPEELSKYLALGGVAAGGGEGRVAVDERGRLQRGPHGGGR